MKKIYAVFIALALVAFCKQSMAQAVTVTFQVDMHNYLKSGDTILAAGMRVGGTFSTDSASAYGDKMLNWTPGDTASRMTTTGDSIWSITLTFAASVVGVGDTLQFKFVNGTWYPTGTNEDANGDHSLVLGGCSPATGGAADNRLFAIPVTGGTTYKWCYDSCGSCASSANGILQVGNKEAVFLLAPNPAVNKQSTLMYSVSEYSPVTVAVYNVLGQIVNTVVNTNRPAGIYNQPIDFSNMAAGVYFVHLTSGNQTFSRKVVVN